MKTGIRRARLAGVLVSAAVLIAAGASGAVWAAPVIYQFGSTPQATFAGSFGTQVNLAGSMIGAYNPAAAPPVLTRTLTGAFGFSPGAPTNQRISPVTATGSSNGNIASTPAGTYRLVVDTAARTVTILDLTLNLLGTQQPSFPVSASITYPSFRTRDPNYTYFFLGAFPLPVGSAVIDALRAEQTAGANGVLTPAGSGFTFSVPVPMDLVVTATLSGATNSAGVSNLVTVTGTVTPGANGTATASLSFTQSGTNPIPPTPVDPPPAPVPFDLPPPPLSTGADASVLLTLLVTSGNVTVNGTSVVPAMGTVRRLSDIAGGTPSGGDGTVDGSDFIAFINAFGAGSPEADIVGPGGSIGPDGTIDGDDFISFINDFAA